MCEGLDFRQMTIYTKRVSFLEGSILSDLDHYFLINEAESLSVDELLEISQAGPPDLM